MQVEKRTMRLGGRRRTGAKLALGVGALIFSLAILELGARVSYRFATGESFSAALFRERLAPAPDSDLVLRPREADPDDQLDRVANKVLHPFLGFVSDRAHRPKRTNRFGFRGPDPLIPPTADEIRVAILGGSLAVQLYTQGGPSLRRALAANPRFAGKRVTLIALCMGGYKQPQQLMALAWFLSLGAHFDLAINLDGFNEIVLPFTDNVPEGVFGAFPRSWKLYSQKALDGSQLNRLVRLAQIETERTRWRAALATGVPGTSAFALRVLDRIDTALAADLEQTERAFRESLGQGRATFQTTGPFEAYANTAAEFTDHVALWKTSSLQLHRLSRANGIEYFHFLQPNQYVLGSKPWSGIERSQFIVPGKYPPKTAVRRAYPLLAQAGAELREQGVAFTGLTGVFAGERRTVYRDVCCHLNGLGIGQLVLGIAEGLAEAASADVVEGNPN